MLNYDLKRVRAAVQFLVDSSYSVHHIKKLRSYVSKPRALPFREEAEVLNELLIVGRQSSGAMENLIELAEFKRDSRSDYQRQFMAAKRNRDRKVIEFETLVTGRPLSIDERNAALQRQYAVWNKEKTEHLAQYGAASWTERNNLIQQFWQVKESELEAMLAEARSAASKAVTRKERKRTVEVQPKKETVLGTKLKAAINGRQKRPVRIDNSR